jgi:threonine/homoserine/homoserine lactone efflux protein
MFDFLGIGTLLGLSAGFSPGPLLALVISETLRHGVGAGIRIACAPIITDLPIILLTLLVLLKLSPYHQILGVISLTGGLFVLLTGYQSIRSKPFELASQEIQARSLSKGAITNFLSPHPYLFWISIGAPTMTKAFALGHLAPTLFIGSFYTGLVGSKIVLAIAVAKSRLFLSGTAYLLVQRALGILLCLFALFLFRDGLELLGIL